MNTLEEAKTWTLVETGHYNGGRAWFGYEHTCVQQPRLTRFMRCDRKLRTCSITWRIDGADQPSFEAAVAAL